MTSDDEQSSADSSPHPQARTGLSPAAAIPGRKRGRLRHWRLLALALIGTVSAAWGVSHFQGLHNESMRGPYGPFPSPVATQPPLHSAQLVATASRPMVIYSGLAITRDRQGVRAVNIATGRIYWQYKMSDASDPDLTVLISVDDATGDVFVLGHKLSMINARSGRVHWTHAIPDIGGGGLAAADDIIAQQGTLTVLGERGLTGLDRTNGKARWTRGWPSGCDFDDTPARFAVAEQTIAIACNSSYEPDKALVAFNVNTGTQRWEAHTSQLFPEVDNGKSGSGINSSYYGNLIAGVWPDGSLFAVATQNVTVVLDPVSGKVIAHRDWDAYYSPATFSGGIQISLCGRWSLCGDDPNTGKSLWHSRIPGRRAFLDPVDGVKVADGHVYTVSDTAAHAHRQIVVLDARTGGLLGQTPLSGEYGSGIIDLPITDGIITLFDGGTGDLLYAERPDLLTTRNLAR